LYRQKNNILLPEQVFNNPNSYANNLKTILELFIHANGEREKEEMLGF
jgi:hypothetical protein